MDFAAYDPGPFYDEMFDPEFRPRPGCELLARTMAALPDADISRRQRAAERALLHMGITFNVYGHDHGTEKILPFDLVPRVVSGREWATIERGLVQRTRALNLFIHDVYHEQRIIKDGIIPREIVESAASYLPGCKGLEPPQRIWCHVNGTDLVRDADGRYYVLEDNLRCPSGVSYVLHNRQVMKRTFPNVFQASRVRPVDTYPSELLRVLQYVRPRGVAMPTVVVLTPGPYNSAYSEHSFLAQQMGVELVVAKDLVVRDGFVWMRTTRGLARVDVIYRRIDDTFLDPKVFRPDSMLGIPGIMSVVRAGRVALANAPGTGVADDKVIYAFVPALIRYYLGEDPILPIVPTYVCHDEKQRGYVPRESRQAGGQSRERVRRLRDAHGAAGGRPRSARHSRSASARTRGTTSRSRCSASRASPRSVPATAPSSRGGMSTCAPTSFTARISSCFPAGSRGSR